MTLSAHSAFKRVSKDVQPTILARKSSSRGRDNNTPQNLHHSQAEVTQFGDQIPKEESEVTQRQQQEVDDKQNVQI